MYHTQKKLTLTVRNI